MASSPADNPHQQGPVSGRWIVLGMLLFGMLLTSLLFLYWHLHTAPFRELQAALAQKFPGSKPRVEGGRHHPHKQTPLTLRIVMQSQFNPVTEPQRAEEHVDQILQFAAKYHDLTTFETLHVHLYHPAPEEQLHQQSFYRAVAESPPSERVSR